MGQTLTHGVYLPDEGERNCYAGLAANWSLLDGAVGTVAEHTAALAGKAPLVHTHTKADITDFPAYGTTAGTICEGNDSRLSDARTPVAHTHGKADITDLFNSGNTWSALNSYSNGQIRIKSLSQEIGVTPSSGVIQYLEFADKNDAQHGIIGLWDYAEGASEIQMYISDKFKNGAKDPTGTSELTFLSFGFKADGSKFLTFSGQLQNSLIPNANNSYDLGSSSYQWNNLYAKKVNTQSVNGVNPGALSLPTTDSTKWVDLSGSIVANSSYTYTPTVDGWVSVELNNTNAASPLAVYIEQSAIKAACFGNAPKETGGNFYGSACIPVRANIAVNIYARGSSSVVSSAYFMPCEGNV